LAERLALGEYDQLYHFTGQVLVEIDPRYFRLTEVDLRLKCYYRKHDADRE
jgi:GDP-D-mannose dehydratase